MALSEEDTITFFDDDARQHAIVIVRATNRKVGLCISLEQNGDLEVFVPIAESRLILNALRSAISQAEEQVG